MRLIDADELIKYCDDHWIPLNVDAVNAQPEIVRCKNCKYRYDEGKCPMVFGYYVDYDDDGYWESEWRTEDNTEDEGFCHKGERSEDGTDR